jgi:hypothetical protein
MASPTVNVITEDRNKELETLIKRELQSCKHGLKKARLEWEKMKKLEDGASEADKEALDEAHKRIKQQESIYNERDKLLKALPTNHKVTLVHNDLLVEHKKEALLMEESFNAIKIAKVRLYKERLRRTEMTRAAHEREIRAFERAIPKLRQVAEMICIFLGDVTTMDLDPLG